MKLASSTALLALAATTFNSGAAAAGANNSTGLRGGAEARTTSYTVYRGEPSYLEFYKGGCVGYDYLKPGYKAEIKDCGDDDHAAYVAYRDDYLIELYNDNKYCFEARKSSSGSVDVYLDSCDPDDWAQQWYVVSQRYKPSGSSSYKYYYRVCNWKYYYCFEKDKSDRYDIDFESFDRYEQYQWFKLDRDFRDFYG
jgi:hypothetical protein